MTTKFRARFDGQALIPLEPVPFPTGQLLEVEVSEAGAAISPGSAQAIVRAMMEPPHLSKDDQEEFERLIEEHQGALEDGHTFDDEGR